MMAAPVASAAVIENFDGYGVLSTTVLDPTTVAGSGWSRGGVGDADWVVSCCASDGDGGSGVLSDKPVDGSEAALYLHRANNNTPGASDENTDFTGFAAFTTGVLSLQMNNSSTGGGGSPGNADNGTDAFNMELLGGGVRAFRLEMGEIHNNAPEFELFDIETGPTALLATGNVPGGEGVSGWPDAWFRWYEISASFDGAGNYSVDIEDIGNKEGVGPTGNVLSYTGVLPAGIGAIDTLRFGPNQANGGSINYDATMIDNIAFVPEPGTIALLGLGFVMLGLRRRG